jgi:hypothetical protein
MGLSSSKVNVAVRSKTDHNDSGQLRCGGQRGEFLSVHLRDPGEAAVALLDEQYQLRVAKNGFANIR